MVRFCRSTLFDLVWSYRILSDGNNVFPRCVSWIYIRKSKTDCVTDIFAHVSIYSQPKRTFVAVDCTAELLFRSFALSTQSFELFSCGNRQR